MEVFVIVVTEADLCTSYCNSTGHYVDVEDCGDSGYCCGQPQSKTCCVDYVEVKVKLCVYKC